MCERVMCCATCSHFGTCAPDRQTAFIRACHNASWSNVLDGALHYRSLALLLHAKIGETCSAVSRHVVNQLFVRFHADVTENTATSERCSIWKAWARRNRVWLLSRTGVVPARVAMLSRCTRRVVPRPAALLALLWLACRQLAQRFRRPGHRRRVQQALARR